MAWMLNWLKPYIEWALLVFFCMVVWSWMVQTIFNAIKEVGRYLITVYFIAQREALTETALKIKQMKNDLQDIPSSGPKM